MYYPAQADELISTISTILNRIDIETAHFCTKNHVLFGNGDITTFEPPIKNKKIFGKQSLWSAIAKIRGFASYKGLLESGKFISSADIIEGMNNLNPYPLSSFLTRKWEIICRGLLTSLLSDKFNIDLKTYQNFKHHDEVKLINYSDSGLFANFYPVRIESEIKHKSIQTAHQLSLMSIIENNLNLITIAESIFLTGLKSKLTPIFNQSCSFDEDSDPCKQTKAKLSEVKQNISPLDTYLYPTTLSEKIKLSDFLNQPTWTIKKNKAFFSLLSFFLEEAYNCKLHVFGSFKNPLELELQLEFIDTYHLSGPTLSRLNQIKRINQVHANLQAAALKLKDKYQNDSQIYSSFKFQNLANTELLKSDEIRFIFNSNFKNHSLPSIKNKQIHGTKLFWINHILSLNPQLLHLTDTPLSVSEIINTIEETLKSQLQAWETASNPKSSYRYHYKLMRKDVSNFDRNEGVVPPAMIIESEYPISDTYALMMCHAELAKLNNHIEQIQGHPNDYYGFNNVDDLMHVRITKSKKEIPGSLIVPFNPFATIKSLCIDNEITFVNGVSDVDIFDGFNINVCFVSSIVKSDLSDSEFDFDSDQYYNSASFTYYPFMNDLIPNIEDEDLAHKVETTPQLLKQYKNVINRLEADGVYDSIFAQFFHNVIEAAGKISENNKEKFTAYISKAWVHESHYCNNHPTNKILVEFL